MLRTYVGQTRRLHLTAVEVEIHVTHRLPQSQERGGRVQHHHELAAVHVDPFGVLIGLEIRLRRVESCFEKRVPHINVRFLSVNRFGRVI